MGAIDILHKLKESGELEVLVKSGVISTNQSTHYDYYCEYIALRPKYKTSKEVYGVLCFKYYVSFETVKRVVSRMKKLDE